MLLLGFDMAQSQSERVWGMSSFAFGALIIAFGALLFAISYAWRREGKSRVSGLIRD
jgi:hypothetical protein